MAKTGTSNKFVEEGFAEIDEMTRKELEATETISNIVSGTTTAYGTLDVGGAKIRFKKFLDRKTRHLLAKAEKLEERDIVGVETVMYDTLAALCVDNPYTRREFWIIVEEKGGDASDVLKRIMKEVNATTEEVKDFRGKP